MLLWMNLANIYVWACLIVMAGFGLVGFMDDYDKVKKRSHKGVSGRVRLMFEFIIAGIAVYMISRSAGTDLYLPLIKGPVGDFGWF